LGIERVSGKHYFWRPPILEGSLKSGTEQLLSKHRQPATDTENSQDGTLVMDLH
jgi:hypothetical protein